MKTVCIRKPVFNPGGRVETTVKSAFKPAFSTRQDRLLLGQFYTPPALCDLMLALATQDAPPQRLLEPACGAGIFLERAIAQAQHLQKTDLQLVGIEQNPVALELAQTHLGERSSQPITLDLKQGDFLTFTPETIGNFDLIIGNPPYIRPEIDTSGTKEDKNNRLIHYRSLFDDYLRDFPQQAKLFSQKADLYQWFFIHAYGLLKPQGTLAFVVSNSWLDSVFGQYFRHFLWHHFDWLYLVESACERWFPDAAIHPIIVILQKKEVPGKNAINHAECQWIRFHQPLQQLLPSAKQPDYWQALTTQVQTLYVREDAQETVQRQAISNSQPWLQSIHCNLYLRAPRQLLELYQQCQLWKPLSALGTIRYPLKTGINQFFYLTHAQAEQWQIEPEFLIPVMRSSKKLKKLILQPNDLNEFLFCCPYSKQELERMGQKGALAYIQWGEQQTASPRQKRTAATPWPQVISVKYNQPAWHVQKNLPTAHILCNRFMDQRFFFALCQGEFIEDQTFYGLTLDNPTQHPPELIAALLNSTVCCALLAFLGRASLGEGVLQFARCDLDHFPVPDPELYSNTEQEALMAAFQALAQIPVGPWQATWNHPARIHLDHLVLKRLLAKKGQPTPPEDDVERLRQELGLSILQRLKERQQMARNHSGNN